MVQAMMASQKAAYLTAKMLNRQREAMKAMTKRKRKKTKMMPWLAYRCSRRRRTRLPLWPDAFLTLPQRRPLRLQSCWTRLAPRRFPALPLSSPRPCALSHPCGRPN